MLPCAMLAWPQDALPTTLAADESSGGLGVKMTFERVVVWPDGHREIEGVTSKALPSPSSHVLPNAEESQADPSENLRDI
jgi:hypothetical protein